MLAQIECASGIDRLRELAGQETAGPELAAAVLNEAARFSDDWLSPLNPIADRAGCRIENGRVRTPPGHPEAWAAFRDGGWLGLDQPAAFGGQDLPLFLLCASQEIFDRGSVAFGMLATSQRGAARLLAAHAEEAIKAEWLPRLISGEWGATICISEPDAGSDVGRIRTMATPTGDGDWAITGEKIWISFGDNDLAPRIGHCLLARTPDAVLGGAGLSLFLVPDTLDGERNGIVVRRIEEKLGLHGSPTCALGFENARGRLIGVPGRGLAQLFTMITLMRLMVAVQGLGVGGGAVDLAMAYAEERRQGGPSNAPAVAIADHPDIQRLLSTMTSRVDALRALTLSAAMHADIARLSSDATERERSQALVQWLLPILKTYGGETGFDTASDAIQVFGGAGYVHDWPVEQLLRDARVFTIYEGTSGVQALDLVHRRLRRDDGLCLKTFLEIARSDLGGARSGSAAAALAPVLDLLEDAAARLSGSSEDSGAYHFLRLAAYAATGWAALRMVDEAVSDPVRVRLSASASYWLTGLEHRARMEHGLILASETGKALFEAIRNPR